jgi:hypothetical protein
LNKTAIGNFKRHLEIDYNTYPRICTPQDSIYLPRCRWCSPADVCTLLSASVLSCLLGNGNAEKVHPECNLILLNKTAIGNFKRHLETLNFANSTIRIYLQSTFTFMNWLKNWDLDFKRSSVRYSLYRWNIGNLSKGAVSYKPLVLARAFTLSTA